MVIEIDPASIPPQVTLRDPDDLQAFSVVIRQHEHAYVPVSELTRLAGERAADPQWRDGLEQMIAYAASKGWTSEDGAIRAHIEIETEASGSA